VSPRTLQRISDVATTLFVGRGFEHVKVAEIARIVGVSEKTVFNYFPTKESLVFDRADEGIERLSRALRDREPGESPVRAMLEALSEDPEELAALPDEIHMFMPLFSAGEQAWKDARKQGKKSLREAHTIAERAAYEAFRQKLGERHEAIRERHASFTRDDARER
jgi:AcrR family transcriptional regulator